MFQLFGGFGVEAVVGFCKDAHDFFINRDKKPYWSFFLLPVRKSFIHMRSEV